MIQRKTKMEKAESSATRTQLSFCDIVHDSTSSLIEKMQSFLPINMEMYSDFYMECLNSFQDLFGTCYIAEREIEQTIGIDQKFLQYFDASAKAYTKMIQSQIDMANNIQKVYLQTNISAVKTSDEYIRLLLDSYSRMVSNSLNFPSNKS